MSNDTETIQTLSFGAELIHESAQEALMKGFSDDCEKVCKNATNLQVFYTLAAGTFEELQ